ncbi:MAG: FtsX-like permease family protein [Planctomycetes bacterium]|nr:FtsX-like permease family protein [Planctomycetota bacterium]
MVLTILGIALGVAIVVAIYVMDHNTIQSRLLARDPQRGRVDLEVVARDASMPAHTVASQLAREEGVERVAVWREARGIVRAGGKELDVAVYGLDPLPAGPFGHYALALGRDLASADAALATAGILLGEEAARLLGVTAGQTVEVLAPARVQRVECKDGKLVPVMEPRIEPFACTAAVAGVIGGERLGGRNQGLVVVCGLELAGRLQVRGPEAFHVLRQEGADLDRLSRDLRERFGVQDMRSALIGEGADERAFRNGLKVLGGLALLLGMYVVFQTLSHSLVARVRQLGLLRCLGAGAGAVTRIFLLDALLLGTVGAAAGIGLGLGLARLLQRNEISSLGLGKAWSTFEIPWFPVGWTAALGVLFTLAGAMFPLVRARHVSALDILQARGLAPGKGDGVDLLRGINVWMFGLLAVALPLAYLAMTPLAAEEGAETLVVLLQLVGMLGLFGSVLLLAPGIVALGGRLLLLPFRLVLPMSSWLVGKVVQRSSGRVAAAVCGLSAVLIALIGLKTLTFSLRAEVHQFERQALAGRHFLRSLPVTPEVADGLSALPGVLQVDACEGEQRGSGFLLRGLDVDSVGDRGALEGEPELVRQYADQAVRRVIISERLSRHQGLRRGDAVNLIDKNGAVVAYQVLAISDRSGFDSDERAWAVTSPFWMRKDFCIPEQCVEHITLHLAADADVTAIVAAARQLLPGVPMSKAGSRDIAAYLLRDVGRDFRLFDYLLVLMLILAGVGLLNGMTIAALGRARELGVLRALGMSRNALAGGFLIEGAVVAALSSLLSLALAVPMGWVLVTGMNKVAALEAPVTMPYRWFWLAPAAALLISLLAALVPAWRAVRQSPSESVRYE